MYLDCQGQFLPPKRFAVDVRTYVTYKTVWTFLIGPEFFYTHTKFGDIFINRNRDMAQNVFLRFVTSRGQGHSSRSLKFLLQKGHRPTISWWKNCDNRTSSFSANVPWIGHRLDKQSRSFLDVKRGTVDVRMYVTYKTVWTFLIGPEFVYTHKKIGDIFINRNRDMAKNALRVHGQGQGQGLWPRSTIFQWDITFGTLISHEKFHNDLIFVAFRMPQYILVFKINFLWLHSTVWICRLI